MNLIAINLGPSHREEKPDNSDHVDDVRSELLRQRQALADASRDMSNSFDRTVVALSTGALALSVAYISRNSNQANHLTLLFSSWISLASSLAFVLLSFLLSGRAIYALIARIDEQLQGISSVAHDSRWTIWTERFNWLGLITMLLGAVLLGWFVAATL